MLNKLAEWRKDVIESGSDKAFTVYAMYSPSLNGFTVVGAVDGAPGVKVSSQRNDARVFKTLDTVRRSLGEHGISHFVVVG
ncbi:hypothetical protein NVP1165O_46 [Vibrio phage 1.165.O._10N.261.51.B7]|nr:hypothetical protein NVP1157O_44 [Vibrio phage 1.157.O._10N.261.45.B7]AUR91846.1 hypothetical protein NVP1165O_46 [Vibrio phage 1.165.O._10N.261.51.B7]AUR96643.1 hypothetical protein NVP1228O_49 [Vibrio phage 1.228.O._10N.261.49.C1]